MAYCKSCGNPLGNGQSFCSSCGATTAQQTQAPTAPFVSPQVPSKYCMGCGQGLIASAAVCPSCGTASRGFGGQGTKGQKDKTVAILLAVFLSFWTWLYTFDKDKTKFWIGLGVTGGLFFLTLTGIRAFGIFWLPSALGFWIWAIVDTAGRSQSWYSDYPNG